MIDEKKVLELIKNYEQYAEEKGFILNPNRKVVEAIVKALLKKEDEFGCRYCPCRVQSGNKEKDKEIICPCIFHEDEIRKDGHCICRLFVKKQ